MSIPRANLPRPSTSPASPLSLNHLAPLTARCVQGVKAKAMAYSSRGGSEDDGLKFDENDRYGQPLTFTTPDRLHSLRIPEDLNDWNRAALAFVRALPPGT